MIARDLGSRNGTIVSGVRINGELTLGENACAWRRLRLSPRVLRPLAAPGMPGAWYRGLRVMALDGSCMDVADEAANAEKLERAARYARMRELVRDSIYAIRAVVSRWIGRNLIRIYAVVAFTYLFIPVAYTFAFSFNDSRKSNLVWQGFT